METQEYEIKLARRFAAAAAQVPVIVSVPQRDTQTSELEWWNRVVDISAATECFSGEAVCPKMLSNERRCVFGDKHEKQLPSKHCSTSLTTMLNVVKNSLENRGKSIRLFDLDFPKKRGKQTNLPPRQSNHLF